MNSQPPKKGDLTETFQQKARRIYRNALRKTRVWGTPTDVIPFSRIESMAPANLSRAQIWQRSYAQLSKTEKDFYRDYAVRIWEAHDHKVKKKWKQPRELYEHVQAAFHTQHGPGNVISFAHYGNALNDLDAETSTKPPEQNTHIQRDFAYVMVDDMHTADWLMESWLKPAAFESIRPAHINDDAFRHWILQHEYAHISGAGEAQADMIASIRHMKDFGTHDIPRLFADMRAISAISSLRQFDRAQHARNNIKGFSALNPLYRRRLKKSQESVAENLRTYGWGCVEGIDMIVEKGIDHAVKMDKDSIFALSRTCMLMRNKLALELVKDVNTHAGEKYKPGVVSSETSFARKMRAWLADQPRISATALSANSRIKLDIAKRYLGAVDRLFKRDFEPEGGAMPSPQKARARPFSKPFRHPRNRAHAKRGLT